MSKRGWAVLLLVAISAGYAVMGVVSRVLAEGFGTMTQTAIRVFLGFLVVVVMFGRKIRWQKLMKLGGRDWSWLVVMGVLGYAAMIYGITEGAILAPLISVSVVYSTVPFFVFLLGLIFLGRRFDWRVVGLLIVSTWGVGVLASGRLVPILSQFGAGEWWTLMSTVMEALWFVGVVVMSKKLNEYEISAVAMGIGALAAAVVAVALKEKLVVMAFLEPRVIAAFLFGVAQNVWVPIVTVWAFRHLDEVFATQLFLTENLFAIAIGSYFYGERMELVAGVGAIAVVASVFVMNRLGEKD